MRCTMWISVPTPSTEPGRRRLDPLEDALGRADPVGELDDVVRALGVHDHLAARVLGAERRDVLGPEALVHRAVALPEQERRLLDVALLEAAELDARVPHPHRRLVVAHRRSAVLRPRCWSGKNSTLSPRPSAHSRIARAFDDVQTAPPCSPTNAFSAAEEFM